MAVLRLFFVLKQRTTEEQLVSIENQNHFFSTFGVEKLFCHVVGVLFGHDKFLAGYYYFTIMLYLWASKGS